MAISGGYTIEINDFLGDNYISILGTYNNEYGWHRLGGQHDIDFTVTNASLIFVHYIEVSAFVSGTINIRKYDGTIMTATGAQQSATDFIGIDNELFYLTGDTSLTYVDD